MDKETIQQIRSSVISLLGGFVPGVSAIDEIVGFQDNVERIRMENFLVKVHDSIENLKLQGISANLSEKDGSTIMNIIDAILRKIAGTSMESQIQYYHNVLINQLIEPNEHRAFAKLIGVIGKIDDVQVLLLSKLNGSKQEVKTAHQSLSAIRQLEKLDDQFTDMGSYGRSEAASLVHEYEELISVDGIEVDMLKFYLLELKSLGLVTDITPMRFNWDMQNTFKSDVPIYEISNVGIMFLDFIKEYSVESSTRPA